MTSNGVSPDYELTKLVGRSTDAASLAAACRSVATSFGFLHFLYAVRIPFSVTDPYHFRLSDYPLEWRKIYEERGYLRIDPVVRHALSSPIPTVWDEIERSSPQIRSFFHEAAKWGLATGVSAPIYGKRGEVGVFSLAGTQAVPPDPGVRESIRGRLNWLAVVVHEAAFRVALREVERPSQATGKPLTTREKVCLLWAADGRTSKEIADIMGITERTVLFHIENAGRKLGVSGRHNIIARAVALGEMDLNLQALTSVPTVPETHEGL